MNKITRVGVLSFGKIMGISGFLMSLVFAVPFGGIWILMGLVGGVRAGASGEEAAGIGVAAMGGGGGVLIMIAVPLLYGVSAFIVGLIYGLILNVVLGMAGGLELEIQAAQAHVVGKPV